MFTGIVEEIGQVLGFHQQRNLATVVIKTKKVHQGTQKGESIAVDGVCLTVTQVKKDRLAFDLMKETLKTTTLKDLAPGSPVNLERALKMDGRINGHFVTGHADGIGVILKKVIQRNYLELWVSSDKKWFSGLVPKGSICLDGVSLTVGQVAKNQFSVYLIPLTRDLTTLGSKRAGDRINIEFDILAKYVLSRIYK